MELSESQMKRIREIVLGYRVNMLFGERIGNRPAYGVWFGQLGQETYPVRGRAQRITDQPLTSRQAKEAMANLIIGDIIEVLEE